MKKLFFLLAAVGLIFTDCTPDSGFDGDNNDGNGNSTEQPGEDNNEGGGENTGSQIPNNEIWYITTDDNIVELSREGWEGDDCRVLTDIELFGANIVSHTYEDGKGVIKCDGDITKIREAFYDCTTITNITIPNSVTSIGETSFVCCDKLTSIIIPDGVTEIGLSAFFGCTSLTSITIPDSVETIERGAFEECINIESVTLGSGVKKIDRQAFALCKSLTEITIPDSVVELGFGVFEGCTGLTKATIGKGIITVEDGVFARCANLSAIYGKYTSDDNRSLIINGELKAGAVVGTTDYIIPDGVTVICGYVFQDYTTLTNITIPDSVTSIGDFAFHNCYALKQITIPANVTYIGMSAFVDCCGLERVYCKPITPPNLGCHVDIVSLGNIFEHENHFDGCPNDKSFSYPVVDVIYVPTESVGKYQGAYGWKAYNEYIYGHNF